MSSTPPTEGDDVAEPVVKAKRGDQFALIGGYLVTGVLFVVATGFDFAVAITGLVGGAIVRGIYVFVRNRRGGSRPLLSPWTLLLAAFVAAFSLAGSRVTEQEEADTFVTSMCVEGSMQALDGLAKSDWRFSRADYRKVVGRYCEEAIDRGLVSNAGTTSEATLVELRESVIATMLESGEIHNR